jgi:hypothetical protein
MRKLEPMIVRTPAELARALRLSPSDAVEWEIRARINDKLIAAVKSSGLTHAQVAKSSSRKSTIRSCWGSATTAK